MSATLHDLIIRSAERAPDDIALLHQQQRLSYRELHDAMSGAATQLQDLGLERQERVAIYLDKRFETVAAMFGSAAAGGVFVPINPLLKPEQVAYILKDCNVRILVTSPERLDLLRNTLADCHDLHAVILVGGTAAVATPDGIRVEPWRNDSIDPAMVRQRRLIDADMAAILYTSGSTGKPKGVVLSHRNMVCGAQSVAEYLGNTAQDRLLAVLPFSFDYGLSQLTTAFLTGASVVLLNYLMPRDVIRAAERDAITGLAAVPPLWIQLAQLDWPDSVVARLRYITNSGGAMPSKVVHHLRQKLPRTRVFLMYGLTEAFRSTYLPPEELDRRPDSIGKAIPNAEIMVVREDGSPCAPGEPGELVHRGALVALGYWNDAAKTAERFRPAPRQAYGLSIPETAVWSGDTVRRDDEGFLYFIGRKDDMIKTSGYRVSPTEVEEIIYATGQVAEAAALGIPHPALGQAILLLIVPKSDAPFDLEAMTLECKRRLPAYMLPSSIIARDALPRNPNGKIDRKQLATEYQDLFKDAPA